MQSSPAEDRITAALRAIALGYDQAYEALVRDDLERVAVLLDETAQALQVLTPIRNAGPTQATAHRLAMESQGRLMAAMDGAMAATAEELSVVRRGRHALKGYATASAGVPGEQVESRA